MIQELAIILFSQVTSASACETNWSQFEYVYSKRRNKLRTEKARKLVYVHSNLKLLNDILGSESAIWTESTSAGTKITKITCAIDYLDYIDKL